MVPVKRLREAKKRLSRVLNPSERASLVIHMLKDVLKSVTRAGVKCVVVSKSKWALRIANEFRAMPLKERHDDLNLAIRQASRWCVKRGADGILVLPADVPLIRDRDVLEIVSLADREPTVVVSPCRWMDGTNALLTLPPLIIPPRFGPGSFKRHVEEAEKLGVVKIYRSMEVELDIDSIEDLAEFLKKEKTTETLTFLRTIHVRNRIKTV